jgi:hypothetical protein
VPPSVLKLPVDWPPTKLSAQRSRGGSTTALSRSKCRLLCAREPALARKLSYRSSPSDFVRYRSKVGPRPQSESPSELSSPSQGTSPNCFPAGGTGSTMHDIFHMFLSPYLNLDYNVVLKAVPPSGLKLLVDWLAIKGVRVKTAITSTTGDELLCFCRRCNCVRQRDQLQVGRTPGFQHTFIKTTKGQAYELIRYRLVPMRISLVSFSSIKND